MKKIFSLLLLLSIIHVNAQVKFEKLSLDAAINKAASSGKIVFAQFESSTCEQCNEVADKGLSSPELGNSINNDFINIKIDVNHNDRQKFIRLYNSRQSHGTFFIAGNGDLVSVYLATTSNHLEYVAQAEKALSKRSEHTVTLAELEKEWREDLQNYQSMEAYINRRASLQLSVDSLLDIYVSRLPSDSSKSLQKLLFVYKHAPPLFSKADAFIKQDDILSRKVFASFSPQNQNIIANRSTYKTLQKAIAEKNLPLVKKVITLRSINADSTNKKTNDKYLLDYFVGTNDTINYLKYAVDYYDKYYMSETAEQVKEKDSLNRVKMMNAAGNDMKTTIDAETGIGRRMFSYAPTTQYYTRDLNTGGRLIYTSTSDKELLKKAVAWMQQAVSVYESPEAMDTYAKLLYKTGEKAKAIEMQQKAIVILKQRNQNFKRFEEVLSKMKAGSNNID